MRCGLSWSRLREARRNAPSAGHAAMSSCRSRTLGGALALALVLALGPGAVLPAPTQSFPLQLPSSASGADPSSVLPHILSFLMRSMAGGAGSDKSNKNGGLDLPVVVIHTMHSRQEEGKQPESFMEGMEGATSAAGDDLLYDVNPSSPTSQLVEYSPSGEENAVDLPATAQGDKPSSSRTISFTNCHVYINLFGGSQRGFYAGKDDNSTRQDGSLILPTTGTAASLPSSPQSSAQTQGDVVVTPVASSALEQRIFPNPSALLEAAVRRSGFLKSAVSSVGASSGETVHPSTAAPSAAPPARSDENKSNDLVPSVKNMEKWSKPYLIW